MRLTDGPAPIWEIIPGKLYQRGKMFPKYPMDRKVKLLAHYNITHVIALAPPNADPDLVKLHHEEVITFAHFPIPDGLLSEANSLLEYAQWMSNVIRGGGCVLTMCNAGRNRSGLLSAMIVQDVLGMSGEQAMEYVRKHRPEAIANQNFEDFLRLL